MIGSTPIHPTIIGNDMEIILVPLLVGIPVLLVVILVLIGIFWLLEKVSEEQREKGMIVFFLCVIAWVLGLFFLAVIKETTGITILGAMYGK
jgi:cytochrome c oxidase assembly factor CtaG